MLTILLKILSILGILLLMLLGLLLLVILTVLFVPVAYRVKADRQDELHIAAGLNWLPGLVRLRFFYPDPGNVTVKALWFTIYDSGGAGRPEPQKKAKTPKEKAKSGEESGTSGSDGISGDAGTDRSAKTERRDISGQAGTAQTETGENPSSQAGSAQDEAAREQSSRQSFGDSGGRGPLEKLQYTFRNICDKIREIRENIAYYREILLCDDTKGLLNHAFLRIGKILKSIRPRKFKADVRFGTGSPDTTGYAFAVYGILCPYLGKEVLLVPDFEQAVLEGELCAAGHITVFRLLWNGLMVALDKRLWELISKLKREE